MRSTTSLAVAAALLGLSSSAMTAAAQESTTRGFMLGVHLSGASLQVENQDRNNAGGAGLRVGYGINRRFTLFAQGDGARFDEQSTGEIEGDWVMGHLDLGTRFHFANSLRTWVPFLEAALGYRTVSVSGPVVGGIARDELRIEGPALTVGGGIGFYFVEQFALDVALLWTGGEFTTIRVDNVSRDGLDFDASSTRFNIGVTWWL